MADKVHISWFPAGSGPAAEMEVAAGGIQVLHLLSRLSVTPDTVLVVRDGRPIPVDAVVRPGETLRIVRTVSGG